MIRSALASLTLLASRTYLTIGLGSATLLTSLAYWMNVSEAGTTADEQGPMGTTLTIDQLGAPEGLARSLANGGTMLGVVVLAICASAVAADFSTGAVRNLFVHQPNRVKWFLGKYAALLIFIAVTVLAVVCVGCIVTALAAPSQADTGEWFTSDGISAVVAASGKLFLSAACWGSFGFVVALLTRSAVVSLAVGVIVAIPLDLIVSDSVSGSEQWLPGQLFDAISRGGIEGVAFGQALATAAAAVVIAGGLALTLVRRADINA